MVNVKPAADKDSESIKEFYELEDRIARETGQEKLKEDFLKESAQLRRILEAIVTEEENKAPIDTKVLLTIANMRRISRLAQYLTSQKKQDTMKQLEQVESKYLELQNATSEIHHLQKEVKRCLDFSAGDEDLQMVTEEEFYTNAPENIADPEKTKDDEHSRYLARLKWEFEQRKQLVGTLSEQETLRSVLLSDIDGKEQRLRSLKPKIAALIEAAKPVQDILGVQATASTSSEQRTLFGLLPQELSVLYVQAEAYKDIANDDGMSISIIGSVDEAQSWQEKRKNKEDQDSEDENALAAPRKRTVSSKLHSMKENLIDPHPIYLSMDIRCEEKVKVNLRFRNIPDIRSTVVKFRVSGELPLQDSICSDEIMFDELFPNDFGNYCIDPVGSAKLEQFKISVDSFARSLGKPYEFVQSLTGSGDSQKNGVQLADLLQDVVRRIRKRVTIRSELADQIKLFDRLKLTSFQLDAYPTTTVSELISFDKISEEEYFASLAKAQDGISASNVFYSAVLHHYPSKTKLKASIAIPASYPSAIPEFSLKVVYSDLELTAENDLFIKQLEEFINVNCLKGEHRPAEAKSLIAHQLMVLIARCDVVCAVHTKLNGGVKPNIDLYQVPSEEFDPALPLVYSIESKKFTC